MWIVGSVVAGGSSNLQKLAGLCQSSLCAHLLKLVILLVLTVCHIYISYCLKLSMYSLLMGAPADLNLSACLSCFLSWIPCGGNVFFWELLVG